MDVRTPRRLEVRLDDEHRRRLQRIVESRGATASPFVRAAIDREYRVMEDEEFDALLASLVNNPVDLPGWEELRDEIDEMLEPHMAED